MKPLSRRTFLCNSAAVVAGTALGSRAMTAVSAGKTRGASSFPYILGEPSVAAFSENFISGLKLLDLAADRLNLPRYIGTKYLVFGLEETGAHEPDKERVSSQVTPVIGIDGCRANLD